MYMSGQSRFPNPARAFIRFWIGAVERVLSRGIRALMLTHRQLGIRR
jgi:hypothetical protein